MNMKVKCTAIAILAILLLTMIATSSFPLANGQQPEKPLPVLLIHGYASDASVWETWEQLLRNDNITFRAVTFADDPGTTLVNEDKCGTAVDHASELNQIVEDFKSDTGSEKINIVAHSKGGLDARVYLANNLLNDDVANLIMIGTPNAGSPLADRFSDSDRCKPAVFDLMTTAPATRVAKNQNTMYYTIAGDWVSNWIYWPPLLTYIDTNCPPSDFLSFELFGRNEIQGPDDGIVPVLNVNPGYFKSLGQTDDCHTNLFGDEEYQIAREVLLTPQ
jgi:pimeloyl-ACP methyl ester carboxylesterase